MSLQITLTGRPISVNHMWRSSVAKNGKAFTYMPMAEKNTREAWKIQAQSQLRKQGVRGPLEAQDLTVTVKFFFENKMRRDIENYIKVAFDALIGVAYVDDSQVGFLTASKQVDPGNPRTEIEIYN